ncbi:MAG: DUF3383 family protein [Archaeoglobaceae archaeon]
MPTAENAIVVNLQDATAAMPAETYGEVIIVGEDDSGTNYNQVKTYYSAAEVQSDYGIDSPITKTAKKAFAQGIQRLKVVNVHDGTSANYSTVLSDLEEKKVDYDIIAVTIAASNTNAQTLVNHAGSARKILVLPFIGSKSDAISAFNALQKNEFTFAVAHDDTFLTAGELSGAIAGVLSKIYPWTSPEWYIVQGVNAAGYKTSEVDELENANIATIVEVAKPVISTAKSLDGGWIDIARTKMYLATEIKNALINLKLKLANMNSKIPYTPQGLGMIKATIEKVLRIAQGLGALREDYVDNEGNLVRGYEVIMPNYEDISDSDKASRVLRNVRILAYLSGAISKIELDLVIAL